MPVPVLRVRAPGAVFLGWNTAECDDGLTRRELQEPFDRTVERVGWD
jgi:hypothetical protein